MQDFWKNISKDQLSAYVTAGYSVWHGTVDCRSLLWCPLGAVVAERIGSDTHALSYKCPGQTYQLRASEPEKL